MDYKLTPKELERLNEFPELRKSSDVRRPEIKIVCQTGGYTNLELIIDHDDDGYVQLGMRQNFRIEKLLRSVFGFDID